MHASIDGVLASRRDPTEAFFGRRTARRSTEHRIQRELPSKQGRTLTGMSSTSLCVTMHRAAQQEFQPIVALAASRGSQLLPVPADACGDAALLKAAESPGSCFLFARRFPAATAQVGAADQPDGCSPGALEERTCGSTVQACRGIRDLAGLVTAHAGRVGCVARSTRQPQHPPGPEPVRPSHTATQTPRLHECST